MLPCLQWLRFGHTWFGVPPKNSEALPCSGNQCVGERADVFCFLLFGRSPLLLFRNYWDPFLPLEFLQDVFKVQLSLHSSWFCTEPLRSEPHLSSVQITTHSYFFSMVSFPLSLCSLFLQILFDKRLVAGPVLVPLSFSGFPWYTSQQMSSSTWSWPWPFNPGINAQFGNHIVIGRKSVLLSGWSFFTTNQLVS